MRRLSSKSPSEESKSHHGRRSFGCTSGQATPRGCTENDRSQTNSGQPRELNGTAAALGCVLASLLYDPCNELGPPSPDNSEPAAAGRTRWCLIQVFVRPEKDLTAPAFPRCVVSNRTSEPGGAGLPFDNYVIELRHGASDSFFPVLDPNAFFIANSSVKTSCN